MLPVKRRWMIRKATTTGTMASTDPRYAFPSLTTISPDKESIARLAVARLFDRMKGDEAPPASASVAYRLVARESTAVDSGRLTAGSGRREE
jgi:DNA-binding LacI/PurR family transcriptional regulator